MPWYRTGTVAITAGQTTVTGTGTQFAANSRVGDAFQGPDGRWYEVTNIASATVLSILPAYQGTTVSGGTYGLAPMQGYVKESADRLRTTVDQIGGTLALFGNATDTPTLRTNIQAAKNGANSDITSITGLTTALSVAQGGTGGTTQAAARTNLGLKSAAVADIIGTVSQTGGTPTGSIIERGSNANGDYVKFADGTLICTNRLSVTATTSANGAIFRDIAPVGGNWTYPVAFSAPPVVVCTALWSYGWPSLVSANNSSASLSILSSQTLTSQSISVCMIAEGRWF